MAEVVHSESGDGRIVLSVTVKASPERVYRALTDAREIRQWFFPEAETDPRPGGKYKFTWRSRNPGSDHVREGAFIDLIPGRKVSYTWDARHIPLAGETDPRPRPTVVEFLLDEVPGGTRVTLTHSGWGDDDEWRQMFTFHDEGWTFFVGNLRSVYSDGLDRRVEDMEMKPGTV